MQNIIHQVALFISLLAGVNSDKDSADELYEETGLAKAKLKVPVPAKQLSFTPVIRPEGAPLGAAVTLQVPSPPSPSPSLDENDQEPSMLSGAENSAFGTPLSSPAAQSPDLQVKTDDDSGSKPSRLSKLLTAVGGLLRTSFKKDESLDSVSENNPAAENEDEYEADLEEEVTAEQDNPQPKRRTSKRTRRAQAANLSDTDDEEDESDNKPSQDKKLESNELSGFEFVALRKTRSAEKKASKFNANVYIQKHIENNPGMSSRSKTNLVTVASELRRMDTQCVSSLTGDDVMRDSDEDEVAEAGPSKEIPTENYKVSEVTNFETRKLNIILKKIDHEDDGDKTASEVESDVPIPFKKMLPTILRPKGSAAEKPAKPAREPEPGPSTPTTSPKKPRKEKLVVKDHGAIIINGRKTTLSFASPKSKPSRVLVASPAKDGSLKMKIRSPNKPTFKIDEQVVKTPEKEPDDLSPQASTSQSPTKLKSPMKFKGSMPVEQGTPKQGRGRPRKSEVMTKVEKKTPSGDSKPKKGRGRPPKSANQTTPQKGKSFSPKIADEDEESSPDELETPRKMKAEDSPLKSSEEDEESTTDDEQETPPKKRGRPLKSTKQMTPQRGRGRPLKSANEDESESDDEQDTPPKKRGRPPKSAMHTTPRKGKGFLSKLAAEDVESLLDELDSPRKIKAKDSYLKSAEEDEESTTDDEQETPPKKRGRPPKSTKQMTPQRGRGRPLKLAKEDEKSTPNEFGTPKKGRGRPPKVAVEEKVSKKGKATPSKFSDADEDSSTNDELDTTPRKRGRPPKSAGQMTPQARRGRPPKSTFNKTPNKNTPSNRRLSLQPITPIKSPASRRVSMAPRIEAVREETPSKRGRLLSEGNL
jgi:hypothetical protein